MHPIIHSYRTGAPDLSEVPPPAGDGSGLLTATTAALVPAVAPRRPLGAVPGCML